MDRADATGFGVAAAGHLALLVALSVGFAGARLPVAGNDPIEVSLVDEVGLESISPTPSAQPPAPIAGPEDFPPAPAVPPPPAPPQPGNLRARPEPAAAPGPSPATRVAPRPPAATPAPPKPNAGRRTAGGLSSIVAGLSDRETASRSVEAPAAAAGPEVKASLVRLVRDQLRPHWKSPSGADAELLRTELSLWLAPDGSVTRVEVIGTSGQTASNRPQVKLHQEQALRAVRLASPFNLPDRFYDVWKHMSPIGFDRKLSR